MSTALIPATVDASLQIARAVAPKWWAGQSDVTGRNRVVLFLLKKWGTITTGENWGTAGVWALKNKLPETQPFTDRQQLVYTSTQPRIHLTLAQKSFITKESISYHEKIANDSPTKIIDMVQDKNMSLKASAENNMCVQFYKDSADAATNFDGVETILNTGTTVTADIVAQPSGSYAGLAYDLGTRGGGWTATLGTSPNANAATDWPDGQASNPADQSYDDMAALILNVTSTGWNSGATWSVNCEELMAYMATFQYHRCGKLMEKGASPVHLLSTAMYYQWKELLRVRNQQYIPVKEGTDFGLPEMLNFNGSWVTSDYDIAPGVGYYISPEMMEFASPEKLLFNPHEFVMTEQMLEPFAVTTFGNYKLQPKCFGAYKSVA